MSPWIYQIFFVWAGVRDALKQFPGNNQIFWPILFQKNFVDNYGPDSLVVCTLFRKRPATEKPAKVQKRHHARKQQGHF